MTEFQIASGREQLMQSIGNEVSENKGYGPEGSFHEFMTYVAPHAPPPWLK